MDPYIELCVELLQPLGPVRPLRMFGGHGLYVDGLFMALVIQNDVSNRWSEITIVAPVTSTVRFPLNPVHVLLAAGEATGLSVTSVALLNQIRAVDRIRLIKRLGRVDDETMERADEAIKISLGLVRQQ